MVPNIDLEINNRIEIVVDDKHYKSLIVDIEENFMSINLPVNDGQYLMLHEGENVEINSYSDEGKCFNFFCDVISKGKEGNILYYKLTSPYNVKKIQRRNFFRVNIVNFVEYKNVTNIAEEEISSIPYEKSLMVDLSGSGMKLKLKEHLKENNVILIKILIKGQEMVLKGNVVRAEIAEDKDRVCGIKFLDITEGQTDNIIEELFEIMRKQRANL